MRYSAVVKIGDQEVSVNSPTYFVADIAANHDGDLGRAKELIWKAKEAGADAAKFQHFKAEAIVSDLGFKNLGGKSHQAGWKKSVFDIYKTYECGRDWTEELVRTAKDAKIDFFSSPYDYEALELLDGHVPAYKIGSGDITWIEFIEAIAVRKKPVLLATGASDMADVERAVSAILKHNPYIVLMQCNTNYTGSLENLKYVNLRVLQTFAIRFPGMVLGLSDHTPGHATILGGIALGARVIEKHFTDDNFREGPDHSFAMNPTTWKEMVVRSRELEASLGTGVKRVEENERDTVIVQRRCVRLKRNVQSGDTISMDDVECLRPAPVDSIEPYRLQTILGKTFLLAKETGDSLSANEVGD